VHVFWLSGVGEQQRVLDMTKLRIGLVGLAAVTLALPAIGWTTILGPSPETCAGNKGPSILVKASGFKSRTGKVRVRAFGGSPDTYFDKTKALKRIEYPMPAAGPVDVCVPLPGPGVYAVDVRHDINNNGDTDRADGAGASGNPKITLFDIIFGRKPPVQQVQVSVGQGTSIVPVVVRYM
jgi:uncharacterized protein (DUF2141 family)